MNKSMKIIDNRKITFTISLGIILIGLIVVIMFGFNLGIEFAGGVQLTITVDDTNYQSAVDSTNNMLVNEFNVDPNTPQREEGGFVITFTYDESRSGELSVFEESIIKVDGVSKVESVYISASTANDLFWNALLALGIALVLMLIYIFIRFRSLGGLSAGFAAVLALVHDVLIMLAFVAIFGWLFGMQINSTFVAAVVTIVAYSINNTIVIFDRVRENRFRDKALTNKQLIDQSTYETLGRTMFTSLTTFIAVAVLSLLGVSALLEFTVPIMVGLIAGTYSSLFIAGSMWYMLTKRKVTALPKAEAKTASPIKKK